MKDAFAAAGGPVSGHVRCCGHRASLRLHVCLCAVSGRATFPRFTGVTRHSLERRWPWRPEILYTVPL